MTRVFILIFTFLSVILIDNALSINVIDSLETLLKKSDGIKKTEILIELSEEYRNLSTEKSYEYGLKAIDLAKKLDNKELLAKSIKVTGTAYLFAGNYAMAEKYYKESLRIYTELKDKEGISKLLNNMGLVNEKIGNYKNALENYYRCLKIEEGRKDKEGIAGSYNNIGNIYFYLKNSESSLKYYKKSLKLYEELNIKSEIANILNNIGKIYYDYKVPGYKNKTLECYKKSLEIRKSINDKNGEAKSLNNIGYFYLENGNYPEASDYFFKSLNIRKEISDSSGIANNLINIAETYKKMGLLNNSILFFNQSIEISKTINNKDNLIDAYKGLYEIYKKLKVFDKSLSFYEKYLNEKQLLLDIEVLDQITEMNTKYETEKKENEIKLLTKDKLLKNEQILKKIEEVKKQRTLIISFIIGLILISVFSLFLYRNYRFKKKANVLLANQNFEINQQKDKLELQHNVVIHQRDQINEQKQLITDSIRYAKRIQFAALPPDEYLNSVLPEHFILHKPKDIVSGDFYWATKINNTVILTVADCTGHGVPGAFMSMLGISSLNEIVTKYSGEIDKFTINAGEILDRLRENIIKSLHQTGKEGEAKDGMDIALCIADFSKNILEYAGANNPLYIIRNNELIEIKPDKMPIGIHVVNNKPFINNTIQTYSGDIIYIFSDGYIDQFGGVAGKKFKSRQLKQFLTEIRNNSMQEQKLLLDKKFTEWKGSNEQVDDVTIIGIKV